MYMIDIWVCLMIDIGTWVYMIDIDTWVWLTYWWLTLCWGKGSFGWILHVTKNIREQCLDLNFDCYFVEHLNVESLKKDYCSMLYLEDSDVLHSTRHSMSCQEPLKRRIVGTYMRQCDMNPLACNMIYDRWNMKYGAMGVCIWLAYDCLC